MKFEIELTEEEARALDKIKLVPDDAFLLGKATSQIRAQLPKEKRYKFYTGWFNAECFAAKKCESLISYATHEYGCKTQINGFTLDQLADFAIWYFREYDRFDDPVDAAQNYLKSQEAE